MYTLILHVVLKKLLKDCTQDFSFHLFKCHLTFGVYKHKPAQTGDQVRLQ